MRRSVLGAVTAAATLALAGCAGPYYGGGGYYGGGYYGGGFAYDGFYDNYYGPIYDGYWGRNDVFFYRAGPRGRYLRDRGGHFARGGGRPGFAPFHGVGPRGPGFRGGGPHGSPGRGRR